MNTEVVYVPPTDTDSNDDTIVNEIVKGSETFGTTFGNRKSILRNGGELYFKMKPIDQSKTWTSLGLRAFGAVCGTITDVATFVYELLPTVKSTVTENEFTLAMSFKLEQ